MANCYVIRRLGWAGLPKAVDVAHVLGLDAALPDGSNAKLTAEPLIIHRLVAEHARQNVVCDDLRRVIHRVAG